MYLDLSVFTGLSASTQHVTLPHCVHFFNYIYLPKYLNLSIYTSTSAYIPQPQCNHLLKHLKRSMYLDLN